MRRQHVRVARRRRAGQIEAGANFGLDLANMQELTTLITLRGMREIARPTLFAGPGSPRAGENQNRDPDDWDMPPKARWMRWGTYDRHVQRFNEYEDVVEENAFGQLARLLTKVSQ